MTEKKNTKKIVKKVTEVKEKALVKSAKKETKTKKEAGTDIDVKKLLKAGAHFGHQTQRWNPKMAPFIFTKRNNIHIIDLFKTEEKLKEAVKFVSEVSKEGTILFVGTKKQAQHIIKEQAEKADSPYVSEKWLGGMLTNYSTIVSRIKHMKSIEVKLEEDDYTTKKQKLDASEELKKLKNKLDGIRDMKKLPGAIYIIDIIKEKNAVREAKKLGIPVVAIVDTNVDPNEVDYPIPANDDAIKSIEMITGIIANAVSVTKKEE